MINPVRYRSKKWQTYSSKIFKIQLTIYIQLEKILLNKKVKNIYVVYNGQ